jgi:undecaprenyl-diphosphatase
MPDTETEPQARHNPIADAREKAVQTAHEQTVATPVRRYRFFLFQLFLMGGIAGFLILAILARTTAYFPIDLAITQTFQALQVFGLLTFMRIISWFGFAPQILLIVAFFVILLFILRFTWEGLVSVISAVGVLTANTLIKLLIARPRPGADIVRVFAEIDGFSFPSGHVMFYTTFFGFMAFLCYTHLKNPWLRLILVTGFSAIVALVGPSRIYLGEHWASDVLGGYLLGSLTLVAVNQLYRWGKFRFTGEEHTSA